MKKYIILACVAFSIGAGAAFAQSPATGNTDSTGSQVPYESKDSKAYQNAMIKVESADIPKEIMETLKHEKYKGWESGKMFRSKDGEIYILSIDKGKTFRFDSKGKVIKENK